MSKSANLDILDQSDNDNFIQELRSTSTKINENNASKFFEILFYRFSNSKKTTNNITQAILKTIYQLISTRDEIFQIFINRNRILDLPYDKKIFYRDILNILYVVVKKHPKSITSDFRRTFEELIQYEGKKALLLLYLYVNHFNSLDEDQSTFLELLVKKKCSDRFSSFDTAQYYVLLLSTVIEKSESFRENYIKNTWQIVNQILTYYNEFLDFKSDDNDEFIDIIGNCYISLSRIESYYRTDELDYDLLNSHLQIPEIQDKVLFLLFFVPFQNQPIMENKEFIGKLLDITQLKEYGWVVYVLFDICSRSNTAIDYLCIEKKWLRVGHPFMYDTLRLFLIAKNRLKDKSITLGKEFAILLKKFLEEQKEPAAVKIIAAIISNTGLNTDILNELCKDDCLFFQNLIERAIERKNSYYLFCCALIADSINHVGYNNVLLKFCPVIYSSVSIESRYFNDFCIIGKKLSKNENIRDEFKKLKIQDVLKDKVKNENTKKYAQRFLNALERKETH